MDDMKQVLVAGLAVCASVMSVAAMADETVCKMGATIRRVEVAHQDNDAKKPCEVRYYKDTEKPGEAGQVLFAYKTNVSQCDSKAADFVQKLTSMGYNCQAPATM